MRIGGDPGDGDLLRPRVIAAGAGVVVAFDFGDRRVKAFDSSGVKWIAGGEGGGPGEFRSAFDLAVDRHGQSWVVDPDLNRITVISALGTPDTSYHLRTERVASALPLASGSWALTTDPDRFLMRVTDESFALAFPIAELRALPWFMRQPLADHGPGDAWAAVFPHGDLFLSFQGQELRCEGRLLGAQAFDREAPPDRPFTVAGIAVGDGTALVLSDGGAPDRLRMLDRYRLADCRYLETWKLPVRASALAAMGGAVVVEVEDPSPHLLVLRPILAARP